MLMTADRACPHSPPSTSELYLVTHQIENQTEVIMKLSHIEQMFITEYIKNGGNGTQAYMTVHQNAKPRSAAVSATRWLQKPAIEAALKAHSDRRTEESLASRDKLIKEAHEVKERAKQSDKLQVELNAIDLKGKIAGVYKENTENHDQFDRIIQMCQVNIEVKDESEAIDVKPED